MQKLILIVTILIFQVNISYTQNVSEIKQEDFKKEIIGDWEFVKFDNPEGIEEYTGITLSFNTSGICLHKDSEWERYYTYEISDDECVKTTGGIYDFKYLRLKAISKGNLDYCYRISMRYHKRFDRVHMSLYTYGSTKGASVLFKRNNVPKEIRPATSKSILEGIRKKNFPTPYELCEPVLYKVYQEHEAKVDRQTVIYNSIEKVLKTISIADFQIINNYYKSATGNSKLTLSMLKQVKYYPSTVSASSNYFINWFKGELKKEALKQDKNNTSVRFEGCVNNDCIVRPDILYGGFVKFKIENGMAIVDNLDDIVQGLRYDILAKVAASYGYVIQKRRAFMFEMIQGSEDNFGLSANIKKMQDDFKDKILSYIVPKFAKKAKFKFCEGAYYYCTCAKPCKK